MHAKIEPIPVGLPPIQADTLVISNVNVNALGPIGQASIQYAVGPQTGSLSLEGAAYAAWGTDDDYLYTYTAQQLGLTIVEIVPDAPPAPPAPEPTPEPVVEEPAPVAPVDAPAAPVAPSDEAAPAVDGGTDD